MAARWGHAPDLSRLEERKGWLGMQGRDPQCDPNPEDVNGLCRPDLERVAADIALISEAALTPWPPKAGPA